MQLKVCSNFLLLQKITLVENNVRLFDKSKRHRLKIKGRKQNKIRILVKFKHMNSYSENMC